MVLNYTKKLLVYLWVQTAPRAYCRSVSVLLPKKKPYCCPLFTKNQANIIKNKKKKKKKKKKKHLIQPLDIWMTNIDNEYFRQMVDTFDPTRLHLYKTNISDTEAPILHLNLSIFNGIFSTKNYDKWGDFDFDIFRFRMSMSLGLHPVVYTVDSLYLEFQNDSLKYFEISVPQHIRIAEFRKKIINHI